MPRIKWLEERSLRKKHEKLREYERALFRTHTHYKTKMQMRWREILQQYLSQGKMPPRRLAREYLHMKRITRRTDEMYQDARLARERVWDMLRDLRRGVRTDLTIPEDIRDIIEWINEDTIQRYEQLADAALDQQERLALEKQFEQELDAREQQIDMILQDDAQAISEEWEDLFLSEIASDHPDVLDEMPEELRRKAKSAARKRARREATEVEEEDEEASYS
ncbi:MAG: hypothetical protein ACTSVT_04540 [Candidatus Thorarchaeota archaeon]